MVGCFMSTLGIFFENGQRKSEITMYVLPRAIEGLYDFLNRRKLAPNVPYARYLIFALAIGQLSSIF
jgi:hypothetical protein